jgi:hypothetical protein
LQLTPQQRIYQVQCSVTDEVLCALDAESFDQAHERIMYVFEREPLVERPTENVRILLMLPDEIQGAPHYFPHAYFVLQELRRRAMMH